MKIDEKKRIIVRFDIGVTYIIIRFFLNPCQLTISKVLIKFHARFRY
jgi:hypothetical protein